MKRYDKPTHFFENKYYIDPHLHVEPMMRRGRFRRYRNRMLDVGNCFDSIADALKASEEIYKILKEHSLGSCITKRWIGDDRVYFIREDMSVDVFYEDTYIWHNYLALTTQFYPFVPEDDLFICYNKAKLMNSLNLFDNKDDALAASKKIKRILSYTKSTKNKNPFVRFFKRILAQSNFTYPR